MLYYLAVNLVAVLALAALVGLLAKEGYRGVAGVWTFFFLTTLSFWGWVGFVAIHFIQKWW